MKVFQILGGFCHWDASGIDSTAEAVARRYAPDIVFVDAPDYVHEGWGFDDTLVGDERFIRPETPEGWIYDEETGTFYQEGGYPPGREPDIWDELAIAYTEGVELA